MNKIYTRYIHDKCNSSASADLLWHEIICSAKRNSSSETYSSVTWFFLEKLIVELLVSQEELCVVESQEELCVVELIVS